MLVPTTKMNQDLHAVVVELLEGVQHPPELSEEEVSLNAYEFAAHNKLDAPDLVGPDERIAFKRNLYAKAREKADAIGHLDVVVRMPTERDDPWKEWKDLKVLCRSCCTCNYWRKNGKKIIKWILCFPCKTVVKCLCS